jgi:hypothetical protein
MMQENVMRITAELPGSALKWIHVAEAEFARKQLNIDLYMVSVMDQEHSVTVMLAGLKGAAASAGNVPQAPPYPPLQHNPPQGSRGNAASIPGYEVEISKTDMRILRANYVR